MPTRESEHHRGVGEAAKVVAEHASQIVRLELELAALELKRKVVALGVGIGMGVGALLFVLFALSFGLAAAAAALAIVLPTWAALLIMAGGLFGLAGMLGMLALGAIRRGTPPVPQQAIEEAKLTTQAIKADGTRA
jgi:hypothetical protein